MTCNMCQKEIVDDHFKKTRKQFYHLDNCWWKVKKFYLIILPSILGFELLFALFILGIGLLSYFLK